MESLKQIINNLKSSHPELVSHPNFEKRLRWELIEIEVQDEESYFLEMYQKKESKENPHNLLVPVILGVSKSVDLDKEPAFKIGDFPDVDVDYLPAVRDYLKKEWAPRTFGQDNVCSIGNYGTFGLKSSFIDMVRVHGLDRSEIMKITTSMGLKDDEGQILTMDKALELYPELKGFCERHPEIETAVRKLLYRNRSMGKHAGGLIISNGRIDDFVPLVRGTDGSPVSAWVEGLHGQDLGPVGLIKFDLLVVDGLNQIATATRYVKQRNNLESVCALPGDWDWSDTAYLNDTDSLAMANDGDLKCIFQYDSDGIRALATKGGVDRFDDLVAYVSLYRPSCLQMKMDEEYVERKRGRKLYEVPEILRDVLEKTYGVLCVHENAFISMSDGREVPIKNIKAGDFVHALDENTSKFVSEVVTWAGMTKIGDGLHLQLENGLSTIITPDHKILTANGWKEAQNLDFTQDLIAIPRTLTHESNPEPIAPWLGKDEDVAYLIGMLVGDGCLTTTGVCIATGTRNNHELIFAKLQSSLTGLTIKEYFHTRSWYVRIIGNILANDSQYGNRKTKLSCLIEKLDLRHTSRNKKIPDVIMRSEKSVRSAFLAGLFDADGTLAVMDNATRCTITSTSDIILNDVRKLLLIEGIYTHQEKDRIHIWNTHAFAAIVNDYVVLKKVCGKLSKGSKEGWVPRSWLMDFYKSSGLSQRDFMNKYQIDRQHLRKSKLPIVRHHVIDKLLPESDVMFVRIAKIETVRNQRFYDLSVNNNHNFIADGIIVHNCYQEQVMQILSLVGKIPLRDCYQVIKAISKKKIEGFAKYRDKFIDNGQITLNKTKEDLEKYWEYVQSFSGYGFNLSHATAYSYISARQLYLKSHYPIEFFVSSLQSQDNDDKRRDYITEAINHGVEVMPLTLNKSKETFEIVDEKIYVGFANIKGIGEDKARRIVEMQPYSGIKDFMDRYGTEATTLKPLIGLRIFGDNPVKDYAYFLRYSEYKKQVKDKEKRFEASSADIFDLLKQLLPEKMRTSLEKVPKLTSDLFELIIDYLNKKGIDSKNATYLGVQALAKKFGQAQNRYKAALEKLSEPLLEEADTKLCEDADEKLIKLYKSQKESEVAFYGYLWTNEVRNSSKYKPGFNFDLAKRKSISRPQPYYLVYGIITSVQVKTFKSGKGSFASIEMVDENMHTGRITVWDDDFKIFQDDLQRGNLVSMQVTVSPAYQGFTLYGPPRHKRHTLPAKKYDTRVVVLEEDK